MKICMSSEAYCHIKNLLVEYYSTETLILLQFAAFVPSSEYNIFYTPYTTNYHQN